MFTMIDLSDLSMLCVQATSAIMITSPSCIEVVGTLEVRHVAGTIDDRNRRARYRAAELFCLALWQTRL